MEAFQSYSDSRQEINILSLIQHPSIVSLVAVLVRPLSLILALAPQGSLKSILK